MPVAVGAALIVAVHPLNTEPVNYVSARSALLTAVFYLAAFDAAARDRPVRCVVLAACAMLTKSIAVSLPLVVLAHRLVARRSTGRRLRRAAALAAPGRADADLRGRRRVSLAAPAAVDHRDRAAAGRHPAHLLPDAVVGAPLLPASVRLAGRARGGPARLSLDALAVRVAGLGQPARAGGARRRRVATGACAPRVRVLRAVGGDHAGAGVELLPARRGGERAPPLPRHAGPGDRSPPSRCG